MLSWALVIAVQVSVGGEWAANEYSFRELVWFTGRGRGIYAPEKVARVSGARFVCGCVPLAEAGLLQDASFTYSEAVGALHLHTQKSCGGGT